MKCNPVIALALAFALQCGNANEVITYVPAGQVAAGSVQTIDGPLVNDNITYGYDVLGRVQSLQVGTATATVKYDDLGRVWWSSNMLGVTTVDYIAATSRPATITRPNGLTTVFAYGPVVEGSRLLGNVTTNGLGEVVEGFDYVYDINGTILWQTNQIPGLTTVWNYDYDLANQLTAANQWTNGVIANRYSYSYDKAGNRISEQVNNALAQAAVNNVNQATNQAGGGIARVAGFLDEPALVTIAGAPARMITPTNFVGEVQVGVGAHSIEITATDANTNTATQTIVRTFIPNGLTTSSTYDLAGNLLVQSNEAQVLKFAWDGADHCTAITNGQKCSILTYDGMNRWARIKEYSGTTNTADRRFVWNGTSLAEERDSTGTTVVKRFFPGGFWQKGTNYYYLTDHLGSVKSVTTTNGTVVARFEYDPYGRRTQTFGTMWVDFGFAGLFELPNGLKLAVWRIYDPTTGRWLSRDPIREEGGWNLYAYCGGDPVNAVDPSGLDSVVSALWKNMHAVALGTSPLAEKLLTHYMSGSGQTVRLDASYMAAVRPRIDLHDTLRSYADGVYTVSGLQISLQANEAKTLGNFSARLSGTFTKCNGEWSFAGTMTFSDTYDFDSKWLKLQQTHRSRMGELQTIYGAIAIPGKPFEIITREIPISQSSIQGEAQWAGTGKHRAGRAWELN